MNSYFLEIERLIEVTKGVDGLYDDPQKCDHVVIQQNGMIIGMPVAALKAFKDVEITDTKKPKKKAAPYYIEHRKSKW